MNSARPHGVQRKTLDNNDLNQVGVQRFSEDKGLGGMLSLAGSKTWSRSLLFKDFRVQH